MTVIGCVYGGPPAGDAVRAGSLCTGIGGLDLAVEAHFGAGLAWYSEIEPAPCTVLEREWPGVPNLGDLTRIDWRDVEPVDVLCAGYPCQPFSTAGRRKGTDDPRHLWPFVAEAVRVLRPRRVVLENVAGHLSLGFDRVLGDLAEAGFDAEWCVLRASDVGAAHQRARLFIVAADPAGLAEREPADEADPLAGGREARSVARCGGGIAAADPDGDRRQGEPWASAGRHAVRSDLGRDADRRGVEWGRYEPAIRRWETILGRPAPRPTDDRGRLNPPFVEWLMGYPAGWVDGLTRTQALKALGNAVVPQQGAAAIRLLEDALTTYRQELAS